MSYDPNKKNRYYLIVQWSDVPEFGKTLVGPNTIENLEVLHHMEGFSRSKGILDTLASNLAECHQHIENITSKSSLAQNYCLRKTKFKDLTFDKNYNNIVLFEGTYIPKAYLKAWKKKNDLVFATLISDMNQYTPHNKRTIELGGHDAVLSFFPPPSDYTDLVDAECEIPAPYFDNDAIHADINNSQPEWLQRIPSELDVFFSATSTPVRDELTLPFCDKAISKGLNTYFVYSNLEADLANFKSLSGSFPDEAGFLDPIKNSYLTSHTNCIFEICKSAILVVTDRYRKAVVFNKKYVCNNPSIKELPFYNEKWMKIIESPDDINDELLDWISKKEDIDYGYDGRWEFTHTVLTPLKQVLDEKFSEVYATVHTGVPQLQRTPTST